MRNIKRITEVMKIWNCKRALGLLKQIYRENLFSAVLSLTVIVLLAVVGVMPSFLIGKIIDMAAAGRIDGLFMLNVGLILALGGGKILEITQEYITAESSISVANSLTDRIMERLMHAETAWLSGQKRGEILQAVSDDVETVKRISVSTLPQFLYMLLVAVTSTVTIARGLLSGAFSGGDCLSAVSSAAREKQPNAGKCGAQSAGCKSEKPGLYY